MSHLDVAMGRFDNIIEEMCERLWNKPAFEFNLLSFLSRVSTVP